jgi:UDP-galactopyranose mutase
MREYPVKWERGLEAYYPINDERNIALFTKCQTLANERGGIIFGGRLGQYKYYDMDKVIKFVIDTATREMCDGNYQKAY